MRRILLTSMAIVAVGWAGAANAASPKLKGDYGFTGAASCLVSFIGFDAELNAIPRASPPAPNNGIYSTTFSVEGVRTFNGDGATGTVRARVVSITPPPFGAGPGAASSDVSYQFTYVLDGKGGFTTNLTPGTFSGKVLTGPRTGQTFTTDTLPFTGLINNNASALTLASVEPTVETKTYSTGDVRYRICHRSRVLIWMGN